MHIKRIVDYLEKVYIEDDSRWVTSKELSKELNISDRTIRKYIKVINENEDIVQTKKSKGYKVTKLFEADAYSNKRSIAVDILTYLLKNRESTSDKLASGLYISKLVLENNLKILQLNGISLYITKENVVLKETFENDIKIINFLFKYDLSTDYTAVKWQKLPFSERKYLAIMEHHKIKEEYIEKVYGILNGEITEGELSLLSQRVVEILDQSPFKSIYDIEFIEKRIIFHLSKVLKRIENNIYIANAMVDVIESKYHAGNYYANIFCNKLGKMYDIQFDREEVAYLTLYFENAIRLNSELSVNIAYVSNKKDSLYYNNKLILERRFVKHQIHEKLSDEINIVISDEQQPGSDYVINRFISESDLNQINFLVNTHIIYTNSKKIIEYSPIESDRFELLGNLCEKLGIRDEITSSIMERERRSSTEINSMIAIPHPLLSSSSLESGINIIKLDKPFKWDSYNVNYILIFVLNFNSSRLNAVLVNVIYDLFSTPLECQQFFEYLERKK